MKRNFSGVISYINLAGAILGGTAIVCIVVVTIIEVIVRGLFNKAFLDTIFLGRIAMLVIGFLCAAYALRYQRHVSVTFVSNRLPPEVSRWWKMVGLCICLTALITSTVITFQFALFKLQTGEYIFSDWAVKAWPFQMIIPVALAALSLELARQIVIEVPILINKNHLLTLTRDKTPYKSEAHR